MPVRRSIATTVLITALALTSCGGGSSGGSDGAGDPGTTKPAAGSSSGGAEVKIADFAFDPGSIEVKVGDTVTFTNSDSAAHTATAGDDQPKAFDTGEIDGDGSAEVTFDEAGDYSYSCSIHDYMTGTVRVLE